MRSAVRFRVVGPASAPAGVGGERRRGRPKLCPRETTWQQTEGRAERLGGRSGVASSRPNGFAHKLPCAVVNLQTTPTG